MDYCKQIQKQTDILLKSDNENELELAKIELLLLCEYIPNMSDNERAIKIIDLKNNIDFLLADRKSKISYRRSIETIRISMKDLFSCPDLRRIAL